MHKLLGAYQDQRLGAAGPRFDERGRPAVVSTDRLKEDRPRLRLEADEAEEHVPKRVAFELPLADDAGGRRATDDDRQGCDRALETAVITPPEARDPALLRKLDAVAGRILS